MKKKLLLIIALWVTTLHLSFAMEISAKTNGFYLATCGYARSGDETNKIIRFDDQLLWAVFNDAYTPEEQFRLEFPGNAAYSVKIELTDSNGKEVTKTAVGHRFGAKWDKASYVFFESPENVAPPYFNFMKPAPPNDTHFIPVFVLGPLKDNPEWVAGGHILPRPNELFQISRPGRYTLMIQMQMLCPDAASTNRWHAKLLQFSPMYLKIEKPDK